MTTRVLIVDDHSVVREGLRLILESDPELHVVGEAADGAEAIEKTRHLHPDVVLMDLLMPVMDGIATTSVIRQEFPETEVIILTSIFEGPSVTNAIRAGAISFLLKNAHADELRSAIKSAAEGQVQLSPQISSYLLQEVRAPNRFEQLTARELEVLRFIIQGYSNKEIGEVLHIVENTVKTHVRHILEKLGARSRTHAILVALRLKLVPSPTEHD